MTEIIEGRVFLYNFDFFDFGRSAEETIRTVNTFICQSVCWKFRFKGLIQIFVCGKPIIIIPADRTANGHMLLVPFTIQVQDDICVAVSDTEKRWFRWFRPNTAHVTLEGLEQER